LQRQLQTNQCNGFSVHGWHFGTLNFTCVWSFKSNVSKVRSAS
jgi:hypothetical protein